MAPRRKTTGPLKNPGYKKPAGKPPPCPSALCRCGHVRSAHEGQFGCFADGEGAGCDCRKFVLAKPKKKPVPRPKQQPCFVCMGDEKADWCRKCRRAYDKFTKRDDGTLMSIYKWLTARAWHSARAQAKKEKP